MLQAAGPPARPGGGLAGRDNGYGYVDDLIFNHDGVLTAVITNSDVAFGGGPRAFPFNGDPAAPTCDLPYAEEDVVDREQLRGEPQ